MWVRFFVWCVCVCVCLSQDVATTFAAQATQLMLQHRYRQCLDFLTRVQDRMPYHPLLLLKRGVCQRLEKNYKMAVHDLLKCVHICQGDASPSMLRRDRQEVAFSLLCFP